MVAATAKNSSILDLIAKDMERAQMRVRKAKGIFLKELDTNLAATPYDVVYTEDRIKLKHYRSRNKNEIKTPLLINYALINRETMLDLQPGRSVVEIFLEHGIDLYMIEWGYPGRKDRFQGIDEHVNGYMNNVVDFIRKNNAVDKINLMGICMGGTFGVIYAALYPHKIQNLITTVTPSSFDTDKGLLNVWMKLINTDCLINTFGNLPGDMMNLCFLMLNPARLMIDKYVGFLENMGNKKFVENFIRMEKWIFDSPDLPGEVLRQFVVDCYQKNKLIQNKMMVGGQRVNLNKVTMPLLNIYARYDHLVPPENCDQLTKTVSSKDTEDICLNTGHIGIYVSSKCQEKFAPKIVSWLKQRDN